MSAVPSSFKKGLNNFWFITSIAIGSIYIVKSIINKQRDELFIPEHIQDGELADNENNIARIQPGLPEPTGKYVRKSQFEGAGDAYSSRRKGDRFSGLLDMEWIFSGKDK